MNDIDLSGTIVIGVRFMMKKRQRDFVFSKAKSFFRQGLIELIKDLNFLSLVSSGIVAESV